MIRKICYENAAEYLGLPMAHKTMESAATAAGNGHGLAARGSEGVHVRQVEKGS
jgi:hypothetical protein